MRRRYDTYSLLAMADHDAPDRSPEPAPANEPAGLIERFQEGAKPIVSESGGFASVECLVKLKALSQSLGLSEEEFTAAIASMQGRAPVAPETAERQRIEQKFLNRLRKTLELHRGNLLSFRERQKLIDAGREPKYALSPQTIERLIDQVAREQDVRFTTLEDAQHYLVELVRQAMGESPVLDKEVQARVRREGKKAGLSRGQVEDIIRKRATVNKLQDWSNWIAPALAVAAVLVTLLFLWYLSGPRDRTDSGELDETAATGDAPPVQPPAEDPQKQGGDAWWDVRVAVAMGTARATFPDLWPVLDRVRFTDPSRRAEAYGDLFKKLFADPRTMPEIVKDVSKSRLLREIIIGCHALDPSEESTSRLRESLLRAIPARGDPLPGDAEAYGTVFWTMQTAVAGLGRERLDPARADALALAIGQRVEANLDRRLPPLVLVEQSTAALAAHLYRVLIASVKASPDRAWQGRDLLLEQARTYLPLATLESLDTDFLLKVLETNAGDWETRRVQIERRIRDGAEQDVLKLFPFFRRCPDPKLQAFLAGQFCKRFGIVPETTDVEALSRAMQQKLGLSLESRWDMLRRRVDAALADVRAAPAGPNDLVDQSVRLSRLATLACALAQGDLGHAEFDLMLAAFDRPPEAEASSGAADPSLGEATPAQRESIGASLGTLGSPTSNLTARLDALRGLARCAQVVRDVSADEGRAIAAYLLKPKHPKEYQESLFSMTRLGRWNSVRLGMADAVADAAIEEPSDIQKERVFETVSKTLGKNLAPAATEPWPRRRQILSMLLLRSVYDALGAGEPKETGVERCDKAQQEIGQHYRTQAKLLGVPPEAYSTAATPAEMLEPMIQDLARRLGGGAIRPPDKQRLERLTHESAAVEYLAENDLEKTVLLDRVLAKLLAVNAAAANVPRADRAQKILGDLETTDGKAPDVLTQLRDGHAAVLQLWMLLCEGKP